MTIASLEKNIINLILEIFPKAKCTSKYGGLLFSINNAEHFCGVFSYKGHVSIEFPFGYKLETSKEILEGTGKYRRHLKCLLNEDIPKKDLQSLIKKAGKLSNT